MVAPDRRIPMIASRIWPVVLLTLVMTMASCTSASFPLEAVFLGQDGAGYAGEACQRGTSPDNIHIRLSGIRMDVAVAGYRVEDHLGGVWVWPCNSYNWMAVPLPSAPGQVDLYLKPWREAPAGTTYTVMVQYADGTKEEVSIRGSLVRP